MTSKAMELKGRRKQRGVVLIMALLIVSLVTTIVVSVSWRFNLSVARNENRWHGAQARAYLEGGEQLVRLVLKEDLQQQPKATDHLGEMWARQGDPMPTDEGWIRGNIEDAQGRFNLNLLFKPPQPTNPGGGGQANPGDLTSQYNATQRRFIRFLQTLELEDGPMPLDRAQLIVQAIQDWLDPDNNVTGAGGAERDYYQSQEVPYPIANGAMRSVSDLMVIRHITPEIFKKLEPYVIALPPQAHMNINTMPPELLRSFNSKEILMPLPEADWNALVQARNATIAVDQNGLPLGHGYEDVSNFKSDPVVSALFLDGLDTSDLVVNSGYFIYSGETLVGEQVRRSKSLLFRDQGNVEVIRRTDAHF